jgi:hypothetical protein
MGWASTLEDIWDRFDEDNLGTAWVGGSAGSATLPANVAQPKKVVQSKPPQQARIELSALHLNLFRRCLTFRADVEKAFSEQERHDLASQMDRAKEDYRLLSLKNVLASQHTMAKQAEEFMASVSPLVAKVTEIIRVLESGITAIDSVLKAIDRQRPGSQSQPQSYELKVEKDAIWLLQAWKQLREDTETFRNQLDDFEVGISGELFENIIRNETRITDEKD